jgi:predicted nucleic acid-binding protein
MIVVDTNIICLRWLPAVETSQADALLRRDPDWGTAILWRWEFRNALAGYVRRGFLSSNTAGNICSRAERAMAEREFFAQPADIFALVSRSSCTPYNCEFVAVARDQGVRLITADREVLREFPHIAVSLEDFLAS